MSLLAVPPHSSSHSTGSVRVSPSLCVVWSLDVSHGPTCSRELASRGHLRGRLPQEEKLPKFEWVY